MQESWKDDVVIWRWVGRSGGGMNSFAKVFIFLFGGCTVFKSEKAVWIGRWDGAVIWNDGEMFYGC